MANNHVKVKIDADGAGFHKVLSGINKGVANLGGSLKGQLAAAFSVASIGLITKSILDFGDEIQTMANNLNISTNQAQRFAWAARNANVEITTMAKAMNTLDKAMSEAKGGDTAKAGLLAKLGFTSDDINNLKPEDALMKMLQQSKKQPRNVTQTLLTQLGIRPSDSGKILGAREDILNKDIPLASPDQIAKLDAMGDAFTNIITIVKIGLIPSLLAASKSLLAWAADLASRRQKQMAFEVAAEKEAIKNGEYVGDLTAFAIRSSAGAAWTMGSGTWDQVSNEAEQRIYGERGVKAGKAAMGETSWVDNIARQVDDLITTLNKPADKNKKSLPFTREAIEKEDKLKLGKVSAPAESLGSNEFLKVGGMLGINAQYRLERLTSEANSLLLRITEATEKMANTNTTSSDEFQY
jgi:hypothetical protein